MSNQMRTLSANPLARERRGGQHAADEAEYDRLRGLARNEQNRRHELIGQSREAYQNGDGALAKELSNQAKRHEATADNYNKQAAEYIFRVNNANQEEDTIDLHGLFVEEAEEILATRIEAARRQHAKGLHVIVGKGIHSENHVQKIKPAVEKFCRDNNLVYSVERNAGRIYIDLQAEGVGEVDPSQHGWAYGGQQQQHGGYQQHEQPHYQQHHGGQQQQQEQQQDSAGGLLGLLFGVIKKIFCK
ncbi:hypothetical protein TWF225_007950 [Orbilia oligospora]|uniref:Uncharacterized protein n=1 Tax=Orbilia oligospora TaxID=2813651 RepID=A0A7C8P8W1_ORBOL|nr:hypothetical protein TWF751_012095 [Orbilia oligospora]KAF3178188.1 hypothetical protein TWF225_007950 [Orbilia oligospora]KAF3248459.1 hypothetical protein TWF128_008432 [Orbilia oligospora]KAF3256550.1 hypothetical protein TWF217_006248 [Orbilia oligospora]KAF3279644.1 hypothetical protein TWF132_012056 [Orbilia oligospora]